MAVSIRAAADSGRDEVETALETPTSDAPPNARRTDARRAVEAVFREESARILASLIRACGNDFELAEDAMQEALAVALERWPEDGVPRSPAAWLIATGRRKAIDRLRRDQIWRRKQPQLERCSKPNRRRRRRQPLPEQPMRGRRTTGCA